MSDGSQDNFQNQWLRVFHGRVDSLIADCSPDSFEKTRPPDVQEVIQAQLCIDSLTDENYRETMTRITSMNELEKRVASETYDYLVRQKMKIPSVPSHIIANIATRKETRVPEEIVIARSYFLYDMFAEDDIKSFQNYVSMQRDFSFTRKYRDISLLDIAGLTGSPKIFMYLLENNCPDTEHTESMCVMGGNKEIMDTLKNRLQKKFESYQVVKAAIMYHRHEILDYLLSRDIYYGVEMSWAIDARNTYAFLAVLKKTRSFSITSVERALRASATGILKIICDLFRGIFVKLPYTLSDSWFMLSQDDRVADVFGALSKYGNSVSIRVCEECLLDAEALTRPCVSDLPFDTAREGNIDGLRYFVGTMSPDAESEDGVPLIDYAIMSGDVNVVLFLLSEGADPRVTDVDGRGCLWYSVVRANKSPEIFRLIYSLGVREFRAECAAYSRLPPDNPIHQFYYSMRKSEDNVVFKDRTNSLRANPATHFATPYEPF